MDIIKISESLLIRVKTNNKYVELTEKLNTIDLLELVNDQQKITFWINIYNSFYQILNQKRITRKNIFKTKLINIGKHNFSLDDIEHGILRKRKWKYSLGYLNSPFYNSFIKKIEVNKLDWRIHFALNCGAKSCPPIAFYHYLKINEELDLATYNFLEQEVSIDHEKKVIYLSKIFKWYIGDFKGNKGIKRILFNYLKVNQPIVRYKITYKNYDYTETINYV